MCARLYACLLLTPRTSSKLTVSICNKHNSGNAGASAATSKPTFFPRIEPSPAGSMKAVSHPPTTDGGDDTVPPPQMQHQLRPAMQTSSLIDGTKLNQDQTARLPFVRRNLRGNLVQHYASWVQLVPKQASTGDNSPVVLNFSHSKELEKKLGVEVLGINELRTYSYLVAREENGSTSRKSRHP